MSTHHGILIHVVFSTKYRKRLLLENWRDDLFAYIGGTVREHEGVLIKSGGIEDHAHLLVRFHPKFAISSTIQMFKANSSKWINQTQKTPSRFEWQRGYGAFSVSQSMVETVKKYIGNQEEHHREKTFREEYLLMLKRHEIEFDERYVFDQEIVA